MHVILHAVWSQGSLHVWGEDPARAASATAAPSAAGGTPDDAAPHPFAAAHDLLRPLLPLDDIHASSVELRLPARGASPVASFAPRNGSPAISLRRFAVPSLRVPPARVREALEFLAAACGRPHDPQAAVGPRRCGPSVLFYLAAAGFAGQVLARQRYVPMLRQAAPGEFEGSWHPWLSDEHSALLAAELVRSMPNSARAAAAGAAADPWSLVEDFLAAIIDAECRRALAAEDIGQTVRDRAPDDPHVAWLRTLVDGPRPLEGRSPSQRTDLARSVRRWMMGLEDRGASTRWRLGFRLAEPADADQIPEFAAPPESVRWRLSFHLRSVDRPDVVVDVEDVWLLPADAAAIEGLQLDSPHELLLTELGRASRIYPRLESALDQPEPSELLLTSKQAYEFLREYRPILIEQGFWADAPPWWDSPNIRIGARLQLWSPPVQEMGEIVQGTASRPRLGLGSIVNHAWKITLGDTPLTLQEFEQLASLRSPLMRVGGKWVEVRPEDIRAAVQFLKDHPEGEISVLSAMRLAYAEAEETSIPILGVDASGWVASIFGGDRDAEPLPELTQPRGFEGTLRPYQVRGLSWLAFLERFGLGPCLADDMGLGKTIQMLALLAHEREVNEDDRAAGRSTGPVPPTLLVVPMSVLGNWVHEARRFCPHLRLVMHHGPERAQGEAFVERAMQSDAVITTYALAHRDHATLSQIRWGRIVLDEAQFIKNPAAKQTRAVRALDAERRVALTGTPVENRLAELWSIMEFLNPGYLGPAQTFRRRFAVPIERYRDDEQRRRLRGLIQPFLLRRLKTDPDVISDLPDKIETREYTHLTQEQAELYEACVNRMLGEIESAEGIHRRGLVLAALVRLKQICNHPSQVLKDHDPDSPHPPDHRRSGKTERLLDMIEEVVAGGEQALVFTQFRQMGRLLVPMIERRIEREVLFLHGGTTQAQREQIVARFQAGRDTNEAPAPVLVMSLKAGGIGLNLTAATHVFHFDRWWNPAVENQATDRAYRIGQTRAVEVHKFVVTGTLEERIDEMIEKKTELAEQIIGAGEQWLTELDSRQLRDLLTLRRDAIGDE